VEAVAFLLPIALSLGACFAVLFLLAARAGQFDDLDDPPERILHDDPPST
jgi:cbb3-type cytochrome oxidase maturation protein